MPGRRRVSGRGGGGGSSRHYTTAGNLPGSRGDLPVAISEMRGTRPNLCNSFRAQRLRRILNGLDIVEQLVNIIRLQLERRHIRMPHKNPLPKSLLKIPNRIPNRNLAEGQCVQVRTFIRPSNRMTAGAKARGDLLTGQGRRSQGGFRCRRCTRICASPKRNQRKGKAEQGRSRMQSERLDHGLPQRDRNTGSGDPEIRKWLGPPISRWASLECR